MATSALYSWNYQGENDRTEITCEYHVAGVTSVAATAQIAEILAVVPAIGATYFGGLVAYNRSFSSYKDGMAIVNVAYRTQQFDDVIENSASGTIIDKGFSSYTEEVLRERHPTSGATFVLGSATNGSIAQIRNQEPRLEAWWEKKHTSLATLKAAATTLTGAINSDLWNGYTAAKWLCVDVSSRTEKLDAGDIYIGRYSFAYKPETWVANERTLIWNTRLVASITTATKATAAFTVFKNKAFSSYGFTF